MPADRRLDNILRDLLAAPTSPPDPATTSRLYAISATVLATLTNPLNVTLLSTQILISPAIWQSPDGLQAALKVFSVFQNATLGKLESPGVVLGVEEWCGAVVRGANNNVPRWKHMLMLGAMLSADQERRRLPRLTRGSIEEAFVRAVNLAVRRGVNTDDALEGDVLSLVLSHAMNGLSRKAKKKIDYNSLLPFVIRSIYHSKEGFQSGYFLPAIDHDIVEVSGLLSWPSKSNSFLELQTRTARPLFVAMGGLARLAAAAIKGSDDPHAMHSVLDNLQRFSQVMLAQWRSCRLSEVPQSEEEKKIDEDTRKHTLPVVWQLLKTVLFTTTMILQALTSNMIENPELCDEANGPLIARKTLTALRNFYFITTRISPTGFTSYNFVYYTALDVLAAHSHYAKDYISSVVPTQTPPATAQTPTIPESHTDRLLTLYFLNTAEHLITILPTPQIEGKLLPLINLYLTPPADPSLHPLFESAHTLILALISSPPHAELAAGFLPYYTDAIFKSFPTALSARQFRLAYATLIRECSPPYPISAKHANMVDVLLELLLQRIKDASKEPLKKGVDEGAVGLSEKDVGVLALVDALAVMEVEVMERWLGEAAELVNSLGEAGRDRARERFWEVVSGELDVSRAEVAVRWWQTGGREKVMGGKGVVELRSRL